MKGDKEFTGTLMGFDDYVSTFISTSLPGFLELLPEFCGVL